MQVISRDARIAMRLRIHCDRIMELVLEESNASAALAPICNGKLRSFGAQKLTFRETQPYSSPPKMSTFTFFPEAVAQLCLSFDQVLIKFANLELTHQNGSSTAVRWLRYSRHNKTNFL